MLLKRLLAIAFAAALAAMGGRVARAQWVQTDAPRAGNFSGVLIDSEGVIFVATRDNGIFRSLDSGKTWLTADSGLTNLDIYNEAWVLSCAPNGIAYVRVNEEVYHTLDHGLSWISDTDLTHFDDRFLNSIRLSDGTLLSGGSQLTGRCTLSRSTDNGRTWSPNDTDFTSPPCVLAIRKGNGGKLYLMRSGPLSLPKISMLYLSSDNGVSWQLVHTFQDYFSRFEIVLIDSSFQALFLGKYNDVGDFSGILRSLDDGLTWDTVLSDFGTGTLIQDKHKTLVTASPYSSEILTSSNLGSSWKTVETRFPDFWDLGVTKANMIVAASYGGGMYLLHDGDTSCECSYRGLPYTLVVGMIQIGRSSYLSYTNNVGVWRCDDGGNTWYRIGYPTLPCSATCLVSDGSGRLLFGTSSGLASSTDGGRTWERGIISAPINAMARTDSGSIAIVTDSNYFILDAGSASLHPIRNLPELFSGISLAIAGNGDVLAVGSTSSYDQRLQTWITESGLFNMTSLKLVDKFAYPQSITTIDTLIYVYTDDGSPNNGGLTVVYPDFTMRAIHLPNPSNHLVRRSSILARHRHPSIS